MGLDQYAYSAPAKLLGDVQINMQSLLFNKRTKKPKKGIKTDFAYWRKFSALHAWMRELYADKGGTGEFNCQQVRLMPEDVDALEKAAQAKDLHPVSGFFFGNDDGFTDEDQKEVLEFVTKCYEAFAQGDAVIYDSWW